MKWPDAYGNLFSRTIVRSPRWMTSRSSSSPSTAAQNTQPGSSSADEEPGCVFCAAVEGDDEERLVIHRGERTIVLLNKFPYASGHFMVAPRRHEGDFGELDAGEIVELHREAASGIGALAQLYQPQAYNLGWNLGR